MLKEYVISLTTSCPPSAKKLGYLREAIATWQRFDRCEAAWQSHLEKSKAFIMDAASSCASHRTAVIFGAGQCADIPLKPLCDMFERVVLVDLVFPRHIKRIARELGAQCVEADVTNIVTYLAETNAPPLPIPVPTLFLDDATVDLVVSANILSQLPLLPRKWLERYGTLTEDEMMDVCEGLIGAHLYYLSLFNAQITLITDRRYQTRNKEGITISEKAALYGVALPRIAGERWDWHIAPAPELHPDYDRVHQVVAQSWYSEGTGYDS